MRRKPTAGPVVFGRWSQPAALVNAGLVPPEPFPLEKLLFCARCGQQFIGTHRDGTGIEDSTDAAGSANRPGGVQPSSTDRKPSRSGEFSAHFPDGTHVLDRTDRSGSTPDSAHLAGPADQSGRTHLPGARVRGDAGQPGCACSPASTHATGGTYYFGPDDFLEGDEYAQDPHVYGTFCDCRPGPLEAFRVELAVYSETHLYAFDTDEPVPGLTKAHYALLANRFFTRVEVGPTVDHMTFTSRI